MLHVHAIGPGLLLPLARSSAFVVGAHLPRLDYQRAKWGRVAKAMLRAASMSPYGARPRS